MHQHRDSSMASNRNPLEVSGYVSKAEECERLAKESSDPNERARYQDDAQRWHEIAADIELRSLSGHALDLRRTPRQANGP